MFMCTCLSKRKEGISKSILVFFLVANPLLSPAQTQLAPGDVALLSYSADTSPISRYFDFVLLTDIAVGTPINFTDAGYFSGSLNTLNESMIRFIADTPLDAGTIIHWNSSINDSRFYKDPDDEFSGAFTLAGGGDSLIVYQGQADNPTFLFALNNTDNEASDSQFALGNLSSGDSQLPNGLQLGTNALGTNASTSNGGRHQDNAAYIGPIISGTKKELLLAISAVDNWAFDNSQSIISAQLHSSIVVVADNNNNNNNKPLLLPPRIILERLQFLIAMENAAINKN